MAGFRRAQLRGSDELFRPTAPEATASEEPRLEIEAGHSAPAPAAPSEPVVIEHELTSTTVETITATVPASLPIADVPELGQPLDETPRSLGLSPEELELLAEAVQHLKFPGKSPTRPSIDDFERLEELRQKLLNAI